MIITYFDIEKFSKIGTFLLTARPTLVGIMKKRFPRMKHTGTYLFKKNQSNKLSIKLHVILEVKKFHN